jgi:hypothetical protein
MIGVTVRREKALDFGGCNSRIGNWFAPLGSMDFFNSHA